MGVISSHVPGPKIVPSTVLTTSSTSGHSFLQRRSRRSIPVIPAVITDVFLHTHTHTHTLRVHLFCSVLIDSLFKAHLEHELLELLYEYAVPLLEYRRTIFYMNATEELETYDCCTYPCVPHQSDR